ncbi:MAG: hypothetical protein ACE5F9_15740 [Phycisphaerae bacterium]
MAAIQADVGPMVEHYNVPLDMPALYRFAVGDTSTADGVAVLSHNGGTAGRWLRVRLPIKGSDLTDADATIQVGGNYWRVLPAATLSANRQLTLGTTNAAAGDIVTVTRLDMTANTYAIVNGGPAAGTLVTLAVSVKAFADLYFDGTDWLLMRAAAMP